MKRYVRGQKVIATLMCAGILMGTGMSVSASGDVYEIKLTSSDSSTTIWHEEHAAAAERISERTNGGVDIQLYTGGEMLVNAEGVEAVMNNAAVFYWIDPSFFADYYSNLKTINAGCLWEDPEELVAFWDTELYAQWMEEAEATNVHVVAPPVGTGLRHVLADKPVTSVADLEGMALRVPAAEMFTDMFAAFNTNYQALVFAETYNALETGMIVGLETTTGNLISLRADESMKGDKYLSLNGHSLNIQGIWCGQGYWDTLPAEYQDIITEEFLTATENIHKRVVESEAANLETIKGFGINVIEVPDKSSFAEALADVNAALPGWEDMVAAVQEIRDTM